MKEKEKVTIYDISKRLGISAATVSRALNDHPKIGKKTKALVLQTAREMNYKQNRLAQALKSGKTHNVGVVIPFINRNFFSSVIRGIEEKLTPFGYHVIICQTHESAETESEQVSTLLNTQIDGIFMSIAKTTRNTDHLQKIVEENTPLVLFDRIKEVPGVSTVTIDDFKGAYQATEHLIRQGCKRIAHLAHDFNVGIYQKRYEGYVAALKANNLPLLQEWVISTTSKVETGIDAIEALWNLEEKPDAIFSSSDYAALGAIQELKRRRIKIPEEVAVVGFSNEPFTRYMENPISTVDQNPLLMGKVAAEVFLEQVNRNNDSMSIEKKVVLKPELVVRSTSDKSTIPKNKRLKKLN